ncbi:MAG: serine/threonine protein kinase [Myxococcales bacterium]|nr:serine/threonine protein kinase [Myxococcales bacterium]
MPDRPLECPRCHRPAPGAAPGARCPVDDAPLVAAAARAAWPDDPLLGAELAPGLLLYDVLSDAGGFGRVYAGVQRALGRRVAVKVLRAGGAADARARFLQEARLLARLTHEPRVVTVHDCVDGAHLYMVLALAPGAPLSALPLPVPPDRARALLAEVLAALDAAHREGLVHRDLKPDNILVHGATATLIDFGIAKALDDADALQTASDVHLGTPRYMAPEQLQAGGGVGPWTDVYAAGAVLFELLAGRPPFAGGPAELVSAHLYEPPPSLPAAIPADLAAVVARALAKASEDRYPDAAAMARALAAPPSTPRPAVAVASTLDAASLPAAPPAVSSPRGRWAVIAALVAGLALGFAYFWPRAAPPPPAVDAAVVDATPVDAVAVDVAADAAVVDAAAPDAAVPDAGRPVRPRAPTRSPRPAAPATRPPTPPALRDALRAALRLCHCDDARRLLLDAAGTEDHAALGQEVARCRPRLVGQACDYRGP